jgi:hypothetical protein
VICFYDKCLMLQITSPLVYSHDDGHTFFLISWQSLVFWTNLFA